MKPFVKYVVYNTLLYAIKTGAVVQAPGSEKKH